MSEKTLGRCRLCGKLFAKSGMARHIPACRSHNAPAGERTALLVKIEGLYLPEYWLFLELSSTVTWGDLDGFLREIWMECCGHLSSFECGGRNFDDEEPGSLSRLVVNTMAPGSHFTYTYDFGTSTELKGRALATVPAPKGSPKIQVLARNDPPAWSCSECKLPATVVDYNGYALCAACLDKREDEEAEEDCFLPIVNSPRVGCCAYTGSAEG